MNLQLHEYFQERSMHVRTCYFAPIVEARPIIQGQNYKGGMAELFEEVTAPQHGFIVTTPEGPVFWEENEFKAAHQHINEWLEQRPRAPLDDIEKLQAVNKGALINVHALERSHQKTQIQAPEEGWVVEDKHSKRVRFMDDLTFRSLYETKAPIMRSSAYLYRARNLDRNVKIKFTRLHSDRLVRQAAGHNINFEAGSFLVQLPQSLPREYQVYTPSDFFKLFTPEKSVITNKAEETSIIHVDFAAKKKIQPK